MGVLDFVFKETNDEYIPFRVIILTKFLKINYAFKESFADNSEK